MTRILIVDDDVNFCIMLKSFLLKKGFEANEAFTCQDALKLLSESTYDIILTDFRLPDRNGLELLRDIRAKNADAIVILMTAYADVRIAVKAIKMGAFEYVAKPVNPDEILMHILNSLKKKESSTAGEVNSTDSSKNNHMPGGFEYVYARSRESKAIHDYIRLVAPTDMSVIIEGESGTGKEYIARKIHEESKRKSHPFIAIDCGALSKELAGSEFFGHIKGSFTGAVNNKTGQFETANGGTLFLDEIGNLSYEVQVKLLRAIQERKIKKIGSNQDIAVNVRIITATNEDLMKAVKNGTFREDLFHRLNEFAIQVPPLRERKDDIRTFSDFFLTKANQELGRNVEAIPQDVMGAFMEYSWPGNIRELKNVIRRAVLLSAGEEVQLHTLPQDIIHHRNNEASTEPAGEHDLRGHTGKTEKEVIIYTLQKARYNKSKAARLLNIDRKTLYNKIKLYGISVS